MTWTALHLEVAAEFQRFAPQQWTVAEERLWRRYLWQKQRQREYDEGRRTQKLKAWAEHGKKWAKTERGQAYARTKYAAWAAAGARWRQTPAGREHCRRAARERSARLRRLVIATANCAECGKAFDITAERQRKGRTSMCSARCGLAKARRRP